MYTVSQEKYQDHIKTLKQEISNFKKLKGKINKAMLNQKKKELSGL